jgi:hypothetical protein
MRDRDEHEPFTLFFSPIEMKGLGNLPAYPVVAGDEVDQELVQA